MIIHGGKGNSKDLKDIYLSDFWLFNLNDYLWIEIKIDVEIKKAFHNGCIWKGNIIIFGGKNSNKFL